MGLPPDLADPCFGKQGPGKHNDREDGQDWPKRDHRRETAGTVSEAGSTASRCFSSPRL